MRKRTSPSTSTWMPPRPNATSGPNSGSSVTPIIVSTPPAIIGWISTPSPSSRRSARALAASADEIRRTRARTARSDRQVEPHAADVALVLQCRALQLGDDREAERRGQRRRIVRRRAATRRRRAAGRTRSARGASPRRSASRRRARSSTRAADVARLVGVDVVEAPEQPRRLRAPLGVGGDLCRARAPRSPETRTPAPVRAGGRIERSSGVRAPGSAITHARTGFAVAPARRPAAMPSRIAVDGLARLCADRPACR